MVVKSIIKESEKTQTIKKSIKRFMWFPNNVLTMSTNRIVEGKINFYQREISNNTEALVGLDGLYIANPSNL